MLKTYISIYQQFGTSVNVGGKQVWIEFTGGYSYPYRKKGKFITSNKELQEAIESDSGFGKSFYLEEGTKAEISTEEATVDAEGSGAEIELVEGVDGFRSAQSWLIEKKGLTLEVVKNKALLKEKCEELHVAFADYKL